MASETDIYVSYEHADGEVVEPFVNDLRSRLRMLAGSEVALWIDRSSITAGSNWPAELRQAVAGARSMLAVLSPSYLRSEWATREYESFALSGRPIFAVVLQEFRPNADEVRTLLGDRLYFTAPSLSQKRRGKQYYEFVARVADAITHELQRAAPARAQEPRPVAQAPSLEPTTRPAKGYVFLSYAEEDADFLVKLRAFLGKRGYAYWEFETSDRDYKRRIDLELEGVISNAVATVSVLSEAWKAST